MKKITAMLMALTMATLSLTGCSNEGSSTVSEDNSITIPSFENSDFTYTSNFQIEYTETTTEAPKRIMAETKEELLKGFLNAIGSQDGEMYELYTLGTDSPSWDKFNEAWRGRLNEKGIDWKEPMDYNDFIVFEDVLTIYHPQIPTYCFDYIITEDLDTGLYGIEVYKKMHYTGYNELDLNNPPERWKKFEFDTETEVTE